MSVIGMLENIPVRIVLGPQLQGVKMILASSSPDDNRKPTIIRQTRTNDGGEGIGMKKRILIQDSAVEIDAPHPLVSQSAAIKTDRRAVGKRDTQLALEIANARNGGSVVLEITPYQILGRVETEGPMYAYRGGGVARSLVFAARIS